MFAKIASLILLLAPHVVQGVEAVINGKQQGATKKAIATQVLTTAYNALGGISAGPTFSAAQSLIDAGIEYSVAIMNAPPAATVETSTTAPVAPTPVVSAPAPPVSSASPFPAVAQS